MRGISLLVCFTVFFALTEPSFGRYESSTEGQLYSKVQTILGVKFKTQQLLEAFNQEFELSLQSPQDLRDVLKYRLRVPKTEADKILKISIEKQLPLLSEFQMGIEREQSEASRLFNIILRDREGMNNRLLGVKVPPVFPLYLGYSLSKKIKASPDTQANGVREVCFSDKSHRDDVIDLFLNTTAGGISCAQPVDNAELVENAADALNRKIEMLTGSKIPEEVMEKADADYRLDFSHAPSLKKIWMAYLEYKHDFSGRMMAQALEYHAKRGADIRILLPGLPVPGTNFVKEKDDVLLEQLALNSNVKIKKFIFKQSNFDLTTWFSVLTRSQHAKLLVTISDEENQNAVILGGRNIKDTFYMRKTPDYSKWPEMVQYQRGDEKFGVFRDMEFFVRGREFAEQAAAQFSSFWNFDSSGPRVVRTTLHLPAQIDSESWQNLRSQTGRNYVRQFISLPYVDNRAIEKLFEQMIDSAKNEVLIVTPYLRPLRSLNKAIFRALGRNVKVKLLTSFDLSNDNIAPFTEDMNKMSVNTFFKEYEKLKKKDPRLGKSENLLQAYNWEEKSVMHSKVISIDDQVIFVGSINLDQRGLTNDSENGVLIKGPAAAQFKSIFDKTYLPLSKPLEGKQKINKLYPLLILFLDLLNMT